jgi:2-polyprenyl-3-methyl-5-hydroxy-6-metoxy-1,4-benzoquinol methylase
VDYSDIYRSGEYLRRNPTWDVEDSPWKAKQILRILQELDVHAHTIGEVGCGAGEILVNLQRAMSEDCVFQGYDISPQAIELCRQKSNERLHFIQGDLLKEADIHWDLLLAIDVVEHVEEGLSWIHASS